METVLPKGRAIGSVLVIHSGWGLTGSFLEFGRALAGEGFRVGLADLFDGRVAGDEAAARALRRTPRRRPMYRTLTDDLRRLREGSAGSLGVVGFSMGGHWAAWLSQQPDLPISATVLYYAARGGSFAASRSAFQAHFAEDDPWVKAPTRQRMAAALSRAGRPFVAFDYPGTRHWFAEADRAEFERAAAATALRRTIDHLRLFAAAD